MVVETKKKQPRHRHPFHQKSWTPRPPHHHMGPSTQLGEPPTNAPLYNMTKFHTSIAVFLTQCTISGHCSFPTSTRPSAGPLQAIWCILAMIRVSKEFREGHDEQFLKMPQFSKTALPALGHGYMVVQIIDWCLSVDTTPTRLGWATFLVCF